MRSGWRGAALSQRVSGGPWARGFDTALGLAFGALQSAAGGTAAAGRTRRRRRTGQRSGVAGGGSRLGLDSGSWYKSSERLFPRRAARHNMEIDLAGFVWAAAGARWRAAPMRSGRRFSSARKQLPACLPACLLPAQPAAHPANDSRCSVANLPSPRPVCDLRPP